MVYLKISKLSQIIKDSIPNKKFKIEGEISQMKKSQGSLFLNLKDETSSINAIIWKSTLINIDNELNMGDSITVKGKIDYYYGNGTISFIITKIIKCNGIGHLHKLYKKYKKQFEKQGYFLKIKKLKIPKLIKNILLLTSETGAAVQDFFYTLKNNNSLLNYDLINISVQGINCPKDLIYKLSKNRKRYDLIVITRGGGSFEDLFGFSKCELIEYIYNYDQAVLSAIGHRVDETLLDLVADISAPTPSLAAQFIIDKNKNYINSAKNKNNNNREQLYYLVKKKKKKILKLNNKLNDYQIKINNDLNSLKKKLWQEIYNKQNRLKNKYLSLFIKLKKEALFLDKFKIKLLDKFKSELKDYLKSLENLKDKINNKSEITLYCNDKKIDSTSKLNKKILKNKKIIMTWNNFQYDITLSNSKVILKKNS